jgi:hypothetical protein
MIIIPKEEPVVQNLNSYFLKIDKLVEHYQGEAGSGGIYFKAPTCEAVIFFDEANLLNSYYQDRKERILGQEALKKIVETSSTNNFSVSVYYITPQRLYYWANLANAEILYNDLNSDFTNIGSLIKKLEDEKLNGYIEVKLNENADGGGFLFLFNGQVIGGTFAKGDGSLDRSVGFRDDLIAKIKKIGGIFNVKKIHLNIKPLSASLITSEPVPAIKPEPPPMIKSEPRPALKAEHLPGPRNSAIKSVGGLKEETQRVLEKLEALLSLLERVIQSNRKLKVDFETLLNKKFVEKAGKYDFLDPFFDEFRYSNGRLEYSGKASTNDLAKAIIECVREIVLSLGIINTFRKYLESWKKGFANEMIDFDIEI